MKPLRIGNVYLKENPIRELPYNSYLKPYSVKLRKAGNLPEVVFWMQVTKSRFHSIDFDRQRVIGNFIVDFYVKRLGLGIEVDGSSHDEKTEADLDRDTYLASLGLRIYRIRVPDIMQRLPSVMVALEEYIIREYSVREER